MIIAITMCVWWDGGVLERGCVFQDSINKAHKKRKKEKQKQKQTLISQDLTLLFFILKIRVFIFPFDPVFSESNGMGFS